MFLFKKKSAETPPVAPAPATDQPSASSNGNAPAASTPDTGTIFGLKKQQSDDTDALDALLKGTAPAEPAKPEKSVLGAAPRSFLTKPDVPHRDFTQMKKYFFQFSVFVALAVVVYFQVQINPQFNIWPNSTVHLFEKEKNTLLQTQTDISFANILRATFALDAFSTSVANYNSALAESLSISATSSQKAQSLQDAADAKTQLVQSLTTLKMLLPSQFSPTDAGVALGFLQEEDFKAALLQKIQEQNTQVQASDAKTATRDLQRLATSTALVNSTRLRTTLASITMEDITDDQIDELAGIASNLNKNDFAIMAGVKSKRLAWSAVIQNIEQITQTVDPLYGTFYQGENVGAIIYESYSFDSETGEITLSGVSRTDSSKNFTLIADLLDALESSDAFQNVEMRSFSKAEDEEFGYIANLSISLALEQGPAADETAAAE